MFFTVKGRNYTKERGLDQNEPCATVCAVLSVGTHNIHISKTDRKLNINITEHVVQYRVYIKHISQLCPLTEPKSDHTPGAMSSSRKQMTDSVLPFANKMNQKLEKWTILGLKQRGKKKILNIWYCQKIRKIWTWVIH